MTPSISASSSSREAGNVARHADDRAANTFSPYPEGARDHRGDRDFAVSTTMPVASIQ